MNIRELREKNKLTQTALARTLGVSSNAISAIEGGRLKLSRKLADRIQEVYGELIEPETKLAKAAEKKTAKKIKRIEKKIETAVESAAAEAVPDTGKKVEKKTRRTKAKLQAEKPAAGAAAAAAVEGKKRIGRKPGRARKANVVIQSPMGGEITPDEILAKIGAADTVYIRVDQNKAYWVKGEETGAVDLW